MSNNVIIDVGKSGRRDRMSAGTKVTVSVRNNEYLIDFLVSVAR